eukprot:scaffold176971_cov19-Tisochrysis_lutea.AAC.1
MKAGLCAHSPEVAHVAHSGEESLGSSGSGALGVAEPEGPCAIAATAAVVASSPKSGCLLPGLAKRGMRLPGCVGAVAGATGLAPLDSRIASFTPPMTAFCCSDSPESCAAARCSAEPCVCICLCHGKTCSAMSPSCAPASSSPYLCGDHMPSDRPSRSILTLCTFLTPSSL